MKTIFSVTFLLFSTFSFCQETEFSFTKNGMTDFVVTKCDEKLQADLYKKTLEWISRNYNDPKSVIKAQIENDYIRLEGIKTNLMCIKQGCFDGRYQIEISFKDGKYKFDLISLEQNMNVKGIGWIDFGGMNDGTFFFDDNGNLKPKFKSYNSIPDYFNTLNENLKNYIITNGKNGW